MNTVLSRKCQIEDRKDVEGATKTFFQVMGSTSLLYNSAICRLCGEENENGCFLYSYDQNEHNLCDLINTFLPIKLSNDGRMPRTICPGCNIQLEATMDFIKLIIKGQQILREILVREEMKPEINEMNEQNLLEIHGQLYGPDHPATLQVNNMKPKRKRGRPPRKPKDLNEVIVERDVVIPEVQPVNEVKQDDNNGKRRIKTPLRYREAVQGKELDRIFIQEGVLDVEEVEAEEKMEIKAEHVEPNVTPLPEVIGHSELSGELVVVIKGKGRGRPKGRMKTTKEVCVICGVEFSCIGRYMSHVAQHGKVRFQCEVCRETSDTRIVFDEHQKQTGHIGLLVQFEEDTKQKKGQKKESKTTLKIEKIAEDEVVPDTSSEQSKPESITQNIETQLDVSFEEYPSAEKLLKTDMSPQFIDMEFALPTIQEAAGEIVQPEVNSQETETVDTTVAEPPVQENPPEAKKRLKCHLCNKLFNSKQSKSLHIKAQHVGERPYKCKDCGATFPYPRSLSLHKITHKRTNPSNGFACDLCGKVLNHPSSVSYHKESEHGGQSYACGKCGKAFKHKQLLNRHQLVHTQDRPFACEICGACFKTNANLMNHQSLHSGIKKFCCGNCGMHFAHKTSLTLHLRWHDGLKPYQCTVCTKSFTQKGNLSEHMRIHTGEKPFHCTECPKSFTTSSQYKLHVRRHTGERPYGCAQCGKRFISRESYRIHVRSKAGIRKHRCECGRAFAERCALVKHRRSHTGERPFECPYCMRNFSDCSNRNKHVKQMHKHLIQKKSILAPVQTTPLPPISEIQNAVHSANVQETTDAELEERVIIVTYDIHNDEPSTLHILDADNPQMEEDKVIDVTSLYEDPPAESVRSPSPIDRPPALYYEDDSIEQYNNAHEAVSITDEQGNPIQFTMQDGSRLAITSLDGRQSLQVITRDGQTIPVEINGLMNEEESPIHDLNLQKVLEDESPTAQYFSIMN